MNTLTWLDLYNLLYNYANDINNLQKLDWNKPVIIHDAETGNEHTCDTYFISDNLNKDKLKLTINIHAIYN